MRRVQTWSLPQRAAGKDGGLDVTTYAFAWAATRLREMAHLGRRAGRGWEDGDRARAKQWAALQKKFMKPNPLLRKAMEEDQELRGCLSFAARGKVTDWKEFDSKARWIEFRVARRNERAVEGARRAWKDFIFKDAAQGGGGPTRLC